jgi:hypothetical protein
MKKNINIKFISLALFLFLSGCTYIDDPQESNRIEPNEINNEQHRIAATKLGISYVDYLHMVNNNKHYFPESYIKYSHTLNKKSGDNYEIIKEGGFFNGSEANTLSDSTLDNIDFLFAMDSHYEDANYYVEILDSLFLANQKGRHLKVTKISGNKIFFDEDVHMFVASHYRLVKVKKNEYTDTIISCINYELNKEYE